MQPLNQLQKHTFCSLSYQSITLLISDGVALLVAFTCGFILRLLFGGDMPAAFYLSLSPALLLLPLFYSIMTLYPGTLLHPAEELKRLTVATSLGFLFLAFFVFVTKQTDHFSRAFFLSAWALSVVLVPMLRYITRKKFCQKIWWQLPVIIIGNDSAQKHLSFEAGRAKFMGFKVVAKLCPECSATYKAAHNNVICSGATCALTLPNDMQNTAVLLEEQMAPLAEKYPCALVLIHTPSIPEAQLSTVVDAIGMLFQNTIVIPGSKWLQCNPVQIIHLQNTFGLVLRRNLLDIRRLKLKRILDLTLTCMVSTLAIPLGVLIALGIKLDSKGPIFYCQQRIGQNGKPFKVYKFRTMIKNADAVLLTYLQQHPEAQAEWDATQKLKNDPRITRMGHFLRTTSLDELSQIINVFKGEMSLVGPRPIVISEVEKYKESFRLYARVLPGITGLWQVSGRNDTTYEERVSLDNYYIANWSIWLDIYILFRTIPEVLLRKGAY